MKTEYIEFIFRERSPSGKTCIWEVVSNSSGCGLGLIKWDGSWRQYILDSYEATVWNHQCLANVRDFLINENDIHKTLTRRG